jgi:hypothetical protein
LTATDAVNFGGGIHPDARKSHFADVLAD